MEFESHMKELVNKSRVEITATLQCKYHKNDEWKVKKCFHGKSTRRVTRKQKPEEVLQQNREEMTKEAERAALEKCFRERFGFTEFNDIVIDELNRPIDEEKLYCA